MNVRTRLALTVFLTGALTALGVLATVAVSFMRFERERAYDRANAFLERVAASQVDILDLHRLRPAEFSAWLKSLLLFEPDCQLYLLGPDGEVLATSGSKALAPGFKVALAPVQEAAAAARGQRMPYVMGDDPERMNLDAVISARELRRATIRPGAEAAGYLYLVSQLPSESHDRVALFRSTLAAPAMVLIFGVIAGTTLLAAWVVVTVTRPLRAISDEVAQAAREGFNAPPQGAPMRSGDEFGRLHQGFHQLLATLRSQWDRLRELDAFRREGVSNLSHDLRSPLTASAAALETLQQRWAGDPARAPDAALVELALRNTRNAAALVRSLADLAVLDEPQYRLQTVVLDLSEVLDDIVMRFAGRAAARQVALSYEAQGRPEAHAAVDVELFERALANLIDNALKFTPPGGQVRLASEVHERELRISVSDDGSGIAPEDLPQLFDRLYQSRSSAAPASSEEGKGLGLAIVKRIVELHGGHVEVASPASLTPHAAAGARPGTRVTMALPLR